MVLGLMVLYSIRAFRRGAGDILARGKVRNESSASFGVGNTGINEIIVEPEVTMTNKASHDSAGFLFILIIKILKYIGWILAEQSSKY